MTRCIFEYEYSLPIEAESQGLLSRLRCLIGNGDTAIISTNQRYLKSEWDEEGRIPKKQDDTRYQAIEKVKAAILKTMKKMDGDEEPITPFTLRQKYKDGLKVKVEAQQRTDKKAKAELLTVSSLIDRWIKEGLDNYRGPTKKTVINSIEGFRKYINKAEPGLERKALTIEVINDYARHLQDKLKLRDSSHGKNMKHLRWFLKYINFDKGLIEEIKIRTPKKGERNIIHLTYGELQALEAVNVSDSVEQQKAKDMFLLGCFTGMRVSDLKRISKHRIKNNSIVLTSEKARTEILVPMLKQTKAILERYDYRAPRIAEQKVNEFIKIVCKRAGIDSVVLFKSVKAGKLIETEHEKCEKITTHVAGKTFISLANERWQLTPTDIAAIVGKDVKTILGYYLKPDTEHAAQKMIAADNRAQMHVTGRRKKAS